MNTLSHFSHIYIEDAARSYPLTQELLARFKKAIPISIQNYKEVFNRPRQRWDHQSQSIKLILAVRQDAFLYSGSPFVPNFDHSRFFYTTPVLNCIYGCEYCYLQGLLSSPNIVVFVNSEDFVSAARQEFANEQPGYLCVSYDTDLLALEDLFGFCATWVDFARTTPSLHLEIRTKSANIQALRDVAPSPNVILAWTLSPDSVARRFEHRTPSLKARLEAVVEAQRQGWTVRLCFDPILRVHDWSRSYEELVEETFAVVDPSKVLDVSLGVFRINSGYLREMQDRRPNSKLVMYPYSVERGSASYAPNERAEMIDVVANQVRRFVPDHKVCVVPWQL